MPKPPRNTISKFRSFFFWGTPEARRPLFFWSLLLKPAALIVLSPVSPSLSRAYKWFFWGCGPGSVQTLTVPRQKYFLTPNTRYVIEDVPYGLVTTVLLGRLVGKIALLHESGIHILSAMYGRDFMIENDLLFGLGLLSPLSKSEVTAENIDNDPSLESWKMMAYSGSFSEHFWYSKDSYCGMWLWQSDRFLLEFN